jgi:hypothetical protein
MRSPASLAPRFKTLRPGEKIHLSLYESSVASLRDPCDRLMGSLEEMRLASKKYPGKAIITRTSAAWVTTKNYHEVMSQLNATSQPPAPYAPSYNPTALLKGNSASGTYDSKLYFLSIR